MPNYLALDLGTSSVKAAIIDQTGSMLGAGSMDYELLYLADNSVEARPQDYWTACVEAIRLAVQMAQIRDNSRIDVAGLGLCCQGETMLCLDNEGEPIGNAIVWLDNRAEAEAKLIGYAIPADEIYARTGQIESIATWPAAKILWLRNHDFKRFQKTSHFVLLGDWIASRLSGTLGAEISLQSSSLLLDIRKREWWPDVLSVVGIDATRLAPLVATGERLGGLTQRAAIELDLPEGIPVIAGTLDQVAAALGAGNICPGSITEMTGTVLALATTIEGEFPSHSAGLPIFLHTSPGRYCALPYIQTGGAVLQWLQKALRPAGSEPVDYNALVSEAASVPPGAEGVTFIPHLAGEAFPEFDLQARAAIVGLTLRHGRAHIVRAALEAVAYSLRQAIERMAEVGVRPDEIVSLGGAAANDVWRQIKADVCGLPIRRIACPEASLLGVAMLIAVAVGDFSDESDAVREMTLQIDAAQPDFKNSQQYEQGYQNYLSLSEHLRPYWHRTADQNSERCGI